ncbi:MAG TPA: BON domain-containing protein [Usitatibacter sp.]|nr:BON domain-containing protein [Usitatibacter sp.]
MNARPAAAALLLAFCSSALAATTYSESVGISTPEKRIVGTAAGNDKPSGPAASDERLLNNVVGALVKDPQMKGADIQVYVSDGKVSLTGKATDQAQADHARQVAEASAGRNRVSSTIALKG